ncbi:D-alanyl-D-alanine carboxypeptidase/D-alanyl-D-alanine-endopeptidase [Arthrobacter sulfonylureivorans]|uniref:D-alanyl-D-alanine carboxypeptidase/D-alanyl-D-alanine endopeptidase n=1 Tax=Arthrobacter sulfonylureivorans TaxID=2486855 RepID=UPI0039E578FF
MGRGFRVLTSGLLAVVFAALAVPAGFNLAQAIEWPQPEPVISTPAAQLPPTTLTEDPLATGPSGTAPLPDPATLKPALDKALAFDGAGSFTGTVTDAASGEVLYTKAATEPVIPASNLKTLTAVAALESLGADRRLSTTVKRGSNPGVLYLVGGGDTLLGAGKSRPGAVLGEAGLATLAEQAAGKLAASGYTGELTVVVDDSLYSGPTISAAWDPGDVKNGEIAPVYPMALNAGRDQADGGGELVADAAGLAGATFRDALAQALAGKGLTVAATVGRDAAPADGTVLAEVRSAPVADQVAYMMQHSDNYVAEVLARNTAVAVGKPGSFGGGTEAVREAAERLGIPVAGMVLADASGLSMKNRVSPAQLAAAVSLIATAEDPDLRAGIGSLPIAGLTGTLSGRYLQANAGGAGLVRAKTGTLNSVTSLSGYVASADGRLLIFAFVANGLNGSIDAARTAADRAATVLAGCGCR